MRLLDIAGYVACGLVLVTFYMRDMVPLRVAALCSNVAFLTYGVGLELMPVVLLHGALMPMNIWRLAVALRAREELRVTALSGEARSSPFTPPDRSLARQ